jgi:serine/threonine protein kinase
MSEESTDSTKSGRDTARASTKATKFPKILSSKYEYQILGDLGKGAFGKVYLANRELDNKKVAVKVIPIKHKETCANEVAILKKLPNHLNVCGFVEYFKDSSNMYIVLEYIPGQDLYNYLLPYLGKMEFANIPNILSILQQMIAAIAAIHLAGICHRDIKLENFMVTIDDHGLPIVKLIDFGLSDFIVNIRQETIGSRLWIAPETIVILKNRPIKETCDVWSFGMVMMEIYLGKPQFDFGTFDDLLVTISKLSSPPIPEKLRNDKSAAGIWLCSIATLCLQIDPVQRPSAERLVVFSKTASF